MASGDNYLDIEYDIYNFGSILKNYASTGKIKEADSFFNFVENSLENENISHTTIGFILSKIFDENHGIFSFLNTILSNKQWKGPLASGLNMIGNLFQKYPKDMRPYFLITIKECSKYSLSGIGATEKDKSTAVLCIVLKEGHNYIAATDVQETYEKFYKFLRTTDNKTSGTVLKNIFILLGILARYYASVVTHEKNLVNHFLRNLKIINPSEQGATLKICGGFDGLTDIFNEFNYIFKQDKKMQNEIYVIVKKSIDIKWLTEKHRNDDCRAAVKFITKHSTILSNCMTTSDYEWWHNTFKEWYSKDNENRKVGSAALFMFYKVLADIFKTKTGDNYKRSFQIFYDDFTKTVRDYKRVETTGNSEIRLALHGIGSFAGACKIQNSVNEVNYIFSQIMGAIQQFYLTFDDVDTDCLEYLPDYIKCSSTILHEINDISNDQIALLQEVTILMVKSFPKLSSMYHHLVIESLIITFSNLYHCSPKTFDMFAQRFVYQSLIWTCSHTPIQNFEKIDDVTTYKNYLPLWKELINLGNFVFDNNNIPLDVKKVIVYKIFDEIIKTLFVFTIKLNLKMKSNFDENIPATDPETVYQPENADDFVIFLNIVEFFNDILSTCNNDLFRKWIKRFSKQIIIRSLNAPLVSGYYKLLSNCLKISDSLNYFDDAEAKEDKFVCFQMISKFLEGTISKVQQFKGDLQLACLQLILAAPTCFIKPLLPIIDPVFHVTFTFGLSYIKIADTGMETLERWYKYFDIDDLKPFLKSILPFLDPFLRSKGFTGDPDIKTPFNKAKKPKKNKLHHIENESELLKLQRKILMFVGQLDAEISLYMIQDDRKVENVPWEIKPSLTFTVPFVDANPDIYLDKIVPRIVELALHSSDRKTRSSACEVLHGIVIILLETSKQMPKKNNKHPFSKLYDKIIEPLVQLGCDSDELIKQIFSELMFQLIHWYTSPLMLISFESSVLIDTLMGGVSHPTNTNLRDYSGKCINEFVKWSIKQYDKEEGKGRIHKNTTKIIDKICLYCLHPNSHKRFGAAFAFNHIYVILREENSMVDRFWIELLYSFVMNLSLDAEKINKARNIEQVSLALDHIERVIKEKKNLFNESGYKRKFPEVIGGPFLKNSVMWLLEKTGSISFDCRSKCMALFFKLAPCVDNCKTPKDFIEKYIENENWYIEIYEKNGIYEKPTLNSYEENDNSKFVFEWLNNLLRSLEGYEWLMKLLNNLVNIDNLNISLEFFISSVVTKSLSEIIFDITSKRIIFNPKEIEEYNELKCNIIQKMFNLLLKIIDADSNLKLLNSNLWNLFSYCIYEPQNIGFEIINKIEVDKLNTDIINILNKFNDILSENHKNELCNTLLKTFTENYKTITSNEQNVPKSQRQLLKGLLIIQKSKFKDKVVNISKYFSESLKTIFEFLTENNSTIFLSSSVTDYFELQLELAFQLKNSPSVLWDCITTNKLITHHETFAPIKQGYHFFNTFNSIIMNYFAVNAVDIIDNFFKFPKIPSENNGGDIIMELLKYLSENRRVLPKIDFSTLTNNIMKSCQNYFVFSESITLKEREFQVEFLGYIAKLLVEPLYKLGTNFSYITNWYILTLLLVDTKIYQRDMLKFKIKLINLLPCFTGPNDDNNTPLESTLKEYLERIIKILKIPRENSNEDIDIDSAKLIIFNTWLNALCTSKSRLIFKCIANYFIKIDITDVSAKFDEKMVIYFHKMNIDNQYKSLKLIFLMCIDKNNNISERYKLAKIFLPPMLKNCSYDCFEHFYICHILDIIRSLQMKIENEDDTCQIITDKSINFVLIEVLFSRLKISKLNDNTCPVNKELLESGESLGLLRDLTNYLKSVRKENFTTEDVYEQKLYRIYHCNALNAFISLVSNSKKEANALNIYSYLFYENKAKNEFIWKNIINCAENITFVQNFDSIPKMKNVFINIRRENQMDETNSPNYMKSQNIYKSSLSEDICKYDFTNTLLRTNTENIAELNRNANEYYQQIEVESLDMNNHECIATVCGVIQHMVENGISPLPKDENEAIPNWLDSIRKLMLDSSTETNVKIFFARVIHNTKHIFQHYAKYFYVPVMKLIVDGCAGADLNYFVADLIEMLIKWPNTTFLENEKPIVTKLVSFLLNNAHNDRKDILKFNLEIIKTIIELWKDYIDIPHELFYKKIKHNSKEEKYLGIQLIGIILANNLIPWNNENVNVYINELSNIIQDGNPNLRKSASEVIGMTLKVMGDKEEWNAKCTLLENQVKRFLSRSDETKFVECLEHIQIHYPNIINIYITKIQEKLLNYIKKPTVVKICLKNILRYIETSKKILNFELTDFKDLLNSKENDVILLTLQLIDKLINLSEMRYITNVIKEVVKFKLNSNSNIREAMYQVFITLYKKYNKKTTQEELIKTAKSILLSGLVDSDSDLQEKIQNFWTNQDYLPNELSERYIKLLSDLYSPDAELHYLGYSVFFLLDACKSSEDYEKIMFKYPLSDCKFEDHKLNLSWRSQHVIMPMFSDSFATQMDQIPQFYGVRGTASNVFEPTQSLKISNSLESTSSFIFKTNPTFSADLFNLNPVRNEKVVKSDNFKRKKIYVQHSRRFLKDKGQINKFFATREVAKKTKREEFRKEKVKQRDANVAVFRSYKTGDFPDILIPYSAIIKPLQVLSKRDSTVARQIYVMLLNGLISEMHSEKSLKFLSEIEKYVKSLLVETYRFDSDLIGTFFDIFLKYKKNISIEPDLLVMLSKNSGLISTGSLLLEENIILNSEELNEKRGISSKNTDEEKWVKLADLYKEIKEWDGVVGIFSEKIDFSKEKVLKAIHDESFGSWKDASETYKTLIETDTSISRKNFYYESYFKCYAHLSDWSAISDYVTEELTFDDIWDRDVNQEIILPWFFIAGVYLTVETEKNTQLLQSLHNWMGDAEKSKYIEEKFSEELAILKLIQNDTKSSDYYIENYLTRFLANWSNLNPLFLKTRTEYLINLQKIVDINKYLIFIDNIDHTNYNKKWNNLSNYWQKHNDVSSQSIVVSEMKTTYRKYLVNHVEKSLKPFIDEINLRELSTTFDDIKLNANFSFINYSLKENNYQVAQKYIKKCKNITPGEDKEGITLSLLQFKSILLQYEKIDNSESKLNKLVKCWEHLDNILQNNENKHTNLLIETTYLIHKFSQNVHNIINENNEYLIDDIKCSISNLINENVTNATPIHKYGIHILRRGIKIGEGVPIVKRTKYGQDLSDAYMNLVHFMQKQDNNDVYNDDIIKYVFRAMKFGSEEARQLFPCLLRILENESSEEIFRNEALSVPTWMFISWIPQLLGNLDSYRLTAIADIILKIAETYPQAIMFPYQLSKEKHNLTNELSKNLIDKLDTKLNNPILEKFIFSISSVCVPELNFKYHILQILDNQDNETNLNKAIEHFEKDLCKKVNIASKSSYSFTGPIFESLKEHCEDMKNLLKKDLTSVQLKEQFLLLCDKMHSVENQKFKDNVPILKDFSPWLANFQTSERNLELEIPGQYTGDKKPLIQYHVKLASLQHNVKLLPTLRKPIKICMLGNDSKEYNFLVKFGEDLRQDQRIQQLFSIANNILEKDSHCLQRNLSIETYKVIPLNHYVGLICWVNHTKSLQYFITDVLDDINKNECNKIKQDYFKWLNSAPKFKNGDTNKISYFYSNACVAYNKEQTIAKYREFVNCIPWDILRQSFWSISMDAESFTSLRHHFITSYSVMCIIHWLFGIGDRNLGNTLICQDTGRAVGIDFGYSFETGVRNSPIPELVPFRLTPHIINLMEPLGTTGIIELTMVHVLKALRKQKHILLSAMDVFVNEPTMGWLEIAQNKAKQYEMEMSEDFVPSEKIDNVGKKLDGCNPIIITMNELREGALKNDGDYLRAYTNIVKGDKQNNIRSRLPFDGLTVEQQVQCLLDQATDYNLLGRAYAGFEPWI